MESEVIKKKKVLFLITKSNWGGAQRYVFDLATALPEHYQAEVAVGEASQDGDEPLIEKLESAGITVHRLTSLQRDMSLYKEIRSFFEIALLIRTTDPDIFHINSSKAGGIGAFLGRALFVPRVIFTGHGWAFNEDRPSWQKLIIKFFHWLTIFLAHETIAVSHTLKAQMNWPLVQNKMTVVHNGRPTIAFLNKIAARSACTKIVPTLDNYQGDIWSGTIGELHHIKRHDVMIEAVAKLLKAKSNLRLRHVIISDGELREALETKVAELDLTNHIFFLGHVDEAARLLKAFDIYVQPSRSESLGFTVIEAAQAGLPIIASNVGGIPEIITDGVEGILVPKEDSEALAQSLEKLLSDRTLQNSLAAAAKVKSKQFSMEENVQKTVAVYESTSSSSAL